MEIETKYKYLSYIFYVLIGLNFLLWSNQFLDYTNTLRFFSLSVSLSILLVSSVLFRVHIVDFQVLKQPAVLLLGAGILISTLSLGNANNPIMGLFLIGNSVLNFILLLIAVQLMQRHLDFLKEISQFFTVIVFIVSSVGFLDYLSLEGERRNEALQILSLYANKNLFASILLLFLPFQLLSLFYSKSAGKIFSIATILGSLFLIVILLTRGVWLALALIIIAIIGYSLFFLVHSIRTKKIAHFFTYFDKVTSRIVFVTLIIGSLAVANYTYNNKMIKKNVISHFLDLNTSKSIRLEIWRITEKIISQNPILGVGTGNWKLIFPKMGLENFSIEHRKGNAHFIRPHNDYLWIFAENGIIGFVLYFSLFALMIYYSISAMTKQKNKDAVIMGIVSLGLIGYMTIAFVSFPRERIAHSILLHLLFAIIIVKHNIQDQSNLSPKMLPFFKKSMIILGLSIATLGCLTVSYYQLKGEYYTNKALGLEARPKIEQIIENINGIPRQNKPEPEQTPPKLPIEKRLENRGDSVVFYIPKARNLFYQADFITPLSWYEGMAFARKGWHDRAFVKFKEAYDIHPNHLHVINNLATYHTSLENYDLAIELYEKALKISPNFRSAILNLISTHSLKGNNETALKLIFFHDLKTKEEIERIKPVLYHLQSTYSDIIPKNVMEKNYNEIKEIFQAIKQLEN